MVRLLGCAWVCWLKTQVLLVKMVEHGKKNVKTCYDQMFAHSLPCLSMFIRSCHSQLQVCSVTGQPHQHFPIRLDVCGLKHHDHPVAQIGFHPGIHKFEATTGCVWKWGNGIWYIRIYIYICIIYRYTPKIIQNCSSRFLNRDNLMINIDEL